MENASRQFGLVFGWSIFEFGRTEVPDLTTVVGNCCFPVSSGTTALSRAVLLLGAVLPLSVERYYRFGRYYRSQVAVLPPSTSFHHALTSQ